MKTLKITTIFLIFILLTNIAGCTKPSASSRKTAEKVVKEHFQHKNDNNIELFLTTISDDLRELDWNFENIEEIEIITLELNADSDLIKSYLEYGRGSLKKVSKRDVKVFNVEYRIVFKEETVSDKDGVHRRYYFLIKNDGKWLIDDLAI